jgi:broad specificity phosphatase PhoE
MRLYFVRHAQSEANTLDILAGQIDYPLSEQGFSDANAVAQLFLVNHPIDTIISSPLLRARQTASAFARIVNLPLKIDDSLIEQNMGVFAGKTYAEVESDPTYELDKTRRWDWTPPQGESYRMITERLAPFFVRLNARRQMALRDHTEPRLLIVTHAVTLRLITAILQNSLPIYPIKLLRNSEILQTDYKGLGVEHRLISYYYGEDQEAKP